MAREDLIGMDVQVDGQYQAFHWTPDVPSVGDTAIVRERGEEFEVEVTEVKWRLMGGDEDPPRVLVKCESAP